MSKLTVCLAGATGWAGSELARGIGGTEDIDLVAAVSRSHAGADLGDVIDIHGLSTPIFGSVEMALETSPDVFV